MATYKKNRILGFFIVCWEILKLVLGIIGTVILFFFIGLFLISLSVRNFIVRIWKNIRPKK